MIKNRTLLMKRPCLMLKVAGIMEDIANSNVQEMAIIDTGFSGQVILPQKLKRQINKDMLLSPVLPEKCPKFKGYDEKTAIPNYDTYQTLKIGFKRDDKQYEEIIPEYISFVERDNILIGMELLIQIRAKLIVDGIDQCFSLEK